ncbi:hypothetical protein HAX54_049269 [Datura stramonium]|uniref:MBD domain-containing protein n=1 Tax=Datura stramonium TaxID=4076 RepID=A0ABS8SUM9_DATST|nr:hypothetical protein [Datura stramonium]
MENKAVAVEKNDVVPIELPAPPGWKKRFTPRKSGTPRRNDIVFVSPDGDEIKNKRQLDKYLKSHPGGPPASEFDWGTGDTPRRSTRLGEKSKATETPESETPNKRQRKSSSKKGAEEDGGEQEAEGTAEKKTKGATETPESDTSNKRQRKSSSKKGAKEDGGEQEAEGTIEKETKGSAEPAVPDAEDPEVQDVEIASEKVLSDGDNIKDDEEKTNDGEIAPEEAPASEDKMEIVQEKDETLGEENIEKLENQEAEDMPLDNCLITDNKLLPLNVVEENKIESKPAGTDASSHSAELSKATSASQEERAEEAPAPADALNVLEENKTESIPAGADASSHSAELSKATSASQEERAEEAPAPADAPNVLEENKTESIPAGADASSHSAELSKEISASHEERAEEAPASADALNVLEENKTESIPADNSSHSELSKATSVSQEETAEEAPAAADVQNSNDAKVDENKQIDREIPIEEINGTEAAAGVNNSVEYNSVQQEATVVNQVTSS